MQTINATFEEGVLKPKEPLDLPAHAQVRVMIEVLPVPKLTDGGVYAQLKRLPSLGDDAEAFAEDIRVVVDSYPPEVNPWE